ncbi:MAG: ferric reductase-like transmembrane domain-containing protein, partial [Cyanobacteria bacterium P01_H01_bin.130]
QLFRLGGWITLAVGGLTLLRTGQMVDYTGHCALLCLMLALLARPIAKLWPAPLKYRRAIGVAAYVLAIAHCAHMFEHAFEWQWQAILFLPPSNQWGIWSGAIALILMTPAALTSFDWAQKNLGKTWRSLHLLSLPALILAAGHTIFSGSSYLGQIDLSTANWTRTGIVGVLALTVLVLRWTKSKITA